jgi:indole-3-glycerol phosphate synthase
MPTAPALRLCAGGFDVIAEIKLRSPAAGQLGRVSDDWLGRATAYARAGAAAVSVLTEPTRFDGSLEHLQAAAAALGPLGVPAMRKDFLVDAYQILEARVAGAGGVLVIARMLSRPQITELLDVAAEHHLFVLLEAFDAADLALAEELLALRAGRDERILVGLNCRDLQTLAVMPQRFAELAAHLPSAHPAVAESGVATAAEAAAAAKLGYRLALIGTALMAHESPACLLAEIFAATRTLSC